MTMLPTWAMVANQARARILRGLEQPHDLAPPPSELVYRARSSRLKACLCREPADRTAEVTAIGADLDQFARELAPILNAHRLAGDFGRLALWAPERLLGALFSEMPRGLRACICLTVACDLTGCGETDLRAHIRNEIARAMAGPVRY